MYTYSCVVVHFDRTSILDSNSVWMGLAVSVYNAYLREKEQNHAYERPRKCERNW